MTEISNKAMIGPCGLRCDICTMYRAYHDDNLGLLEEIKKIGESKWLEENK